MNSKIKILLSYHKPDHLFKDEILTPVHAGRFNARQRMDEEDPKFKWLLENTIGDDTGDNISSKNGLYNEMTTVYWAWKNYDKLDNPEYIGFMHYRRHFVFDDTLKKANYECADIGENYFSQIQYSKERIDEILKSCDFVTVKPLWRESMYKHYQANHEIHDLDVAIEILKERHPEYAEAADKYLNGHDAYFCNMFIFPRELFFRYAEWFYDITFELEKRTDLSGKRLFISEWLTGIFITKILSEGKKGRFFPTIIAEGEHEIPVVLAADNNYALPMMVTIASLLQTAHNNTTYNFNLLVSGDFSKANMEKIQEICSAYKKYKLNFINMQNSYENAHLQIAHISKATYYRLQLPSLLPDVNKCIYLDVDLIAKKDLSGMFRINIDDKYLAGVRAAGYYDSEAKIEHHRNRLGLPDFDTYVNAGVLMMNLAKMRKDGMEEIFEGLLDKKWSSQDQDILNIACYGKIRIIDFMYNVMTKYALDDDKAYDKTFYLKKAYEKKDWNHGRKNPTIIHYADRRKPWNDPGSIYAKEWWNVVKYMPKDIALDIYEAYLDDMLDCSYQISKREKSLSWQVNNLKKKNEAIKASITFKIGKIIMYIPRKIKKLLSK